MYKRQIEKVITEKREEVSENQDDIAIIGLSGRYPEAENLVEFWEKLIKGEDKEIITIKANIDALNF